VGDKLARTVEQKGPVRFHDLAHYGFELEQERCIGALGSGRLGEMFEGCRRAPPAATGISLF